MIEAQQHAAGYQPHGSSNKKVQAPVENGADKSQRLCCSDTQYPCILVGEIMLEGVVSLPMKTVVSIFWLERELGFADSSTVRWSMRIGEILPDVQNHQQLHSGNLT